MQYQKNGNFNHLVTARNLRSVYISYSAAVNQLLMPLGLTLAQCEILLHLYQRSPEIVEISELLQVVQIAPSSLSNTLKKLKRNGYVDYIQRDDQRKKQICLTAEALEVQEQITEIFHYLEGEFFSQITDAERKSAEVVLRKIAQNISDIPTKKGSASKTSTG